MTHVMLMSLFAPSALAGPEAVQLANHQVRDGVHGVVLTLGGDHTAPTRRRSVALDPARHRVYPVLTAPDGRVLFDGRHLEGVGSTPADSTTTPALPADDAEHEFFVPYHRLQLEPGTHELDVALWLDGGFDDGPARVVSDHARIDVPEDQWVFASIEQPPQRKRALRWRARVGRDVIAERDNTPAVLVLSKDDPVELDLWDGRNWERLTRRSLRSAAMRAGLIPSMVRALNVRKSPPSIADGTASLRQTTNPEPGVQVDLRWNLTGRAVDALLPIEARPSVVGPDGSAWDLPAEVLVEGPDRARLVVPEWGLPAWVVTGVPFDLAWVVMARAGSGSPLTRDLVLGRAQRQVQLTDELRPLQLPAKLVDSEVVDDGGLHLKALVRWTLPTAMAARGSAGMRASWAGSTTTVATPWTPCAPEGPATDCAEAWGIGPLGTTDGMSEARLPLAWLGLDEDPILVVAAGLDGYRALTESLPVDLGNLTRRSVSLQPKWADLDCPADAPVRLVWSADGRELAATKPRPCADRLRWDKSDGVTVVAFDGDQLDLAIEVGGAIQRRTSVGIEAGTLSADLEEPTAGINRLKIRLKAR